jgi:hypothetical protein
MIKRIAKDYPFKSRMVEICVVRKERLSIDLRKFSCVGTTLKLGKMLQFGTA